MTYNTGCPTGNRSRSGCGVVAAFPSRKGNKKPIPVSYLTGGLDRKDRLRCDLIFCDCQLFRINREIMTL